MICESANCEYGLRISSITRGIGLYHHPHLLEGGETDVLATISRNSNTLVLSLYGVTYFSLFRIIQFSIRINQFEKSIKITFFFNLPFCFNNGKHKFYLFVLN